MKIKNRICNERGSVMMEYVILNFWFMVVLAVAGNFFIAPDGGGTAGFDAYSIQNGNFVKKGKAPQYGFLGNAFIKRYELMLKIVSMPYP